MAIVKMFCIKDFRTEAYGRPVFVQNRKVYERAILDATNDPENMIALHPTDFAAYELGEYDDQTGKVTAHEPVHLFNIVDLVKQDEDK